MKKYLTVFVVFMSLVACGTATSDTVSQDKVRRPAVSGQFYPGSPGKLKSMVDRFLNVKPGVDLKGKEITGIIVPHAGYVYSGATAGYGFSAVKGKKYSTVILLGPSHHSYLGKPCICDFNEWSTPLGKVKVDYTLFNEITSKTNINVNNNIFEPEHSLEVELPFLQRALKGEFKILPILINEFRIEKLKPHAEKLARILKNKKDVLFVMSTDMSHYFKAHIAEKMDKKVTQAMVNNDLETLEKLLTTDQGQLCGAGGVMLGLLTLNELGADEILELHYSHSGMVSGDNLRVVGYGAFAVYKRKGSLPTAQKEEKMGYSDQQKIKLLEIARKTMKNYVREGKKIEIDVDDEELKEERGVFVTLHKDGNLRGCIGNIMPVNKLYLAVRDMAIQSSSKDRRFSPVRENELDDIEIEISVLTVPEKVDSADEVVLGRDGVIVKKGFRQGVYLPQVADETGWSKEEFLSSLCYSKAGLPADAWKDSDTEIYTFQAEVFNEKKLGIR